MSSQAYCQYCGAPHNADAAFCPRCGRPTSQQAGPTQPSPYQQQRGLSGPPGMPAFPQRRSSNTALFVVLAVIAIAILMVVVGAILIFGIASTRTDTVATEPPPVETMVVITEGVPTLATEAVPAGPTPNQTYNGASFYLDPAVASGASAQSLPAVQPSADAVPWEVMPEHDVISLNGYLPSNTFHSPKILIIPADAYAAMDENAANRINELKTLLAARPASITGGIPRLPFWNAGEVFHAKVRYIDFPGGSGIGYLSQYAQAMVPINNDELFYSFQGLTSDGRWLISAVLPVSHPDLPADSSLSQAEYENLINTFESYLASALADLNAKADNSFTPNLEKLDELFRSLTIQK